MNECIETYKLDSAHFLQAQGLVWEACPKKKERELRLLNDMGMLQMVEKVIRARICHTIHRYAKANNKYTKDYYKNKELSYLMFSDPKNVSEITFRRF